MYVMGLKVSALFQTLLMDEHRFRDLKEKTHWLMLVSSVLLVTYNTVGGPIAGITELKDTLKRHIAAIIDDVPHRYWGSIGALLSMQHY